MKLDQLQERVSYDGNGNIQKYLRHGHLTAGNLVMDSLTYKYETESRKEQIDKFFKQATSVNKP